MNPVGMGMPTLEGRNLATPSQQLLASQLIVGSLNRQEILNSHMKISGQGLILLMEEIQLTTRDV